MRVAQRFQRAPAVAAGGRGETVGAGWRLVKPPAALCGGAIAAAVGEIRRESGMPRPVADAYYSAPIWRLAGILQELQMESDEAASVAVVQFCLRRALAAMRAERGVVEKGRERRTYMAFAASLTAGVGGALANGEIQVRAAGGVRDTWRGRWRHMNEEGIAAYAQVGMLTLTKNPADQALVRDLFSEAALAWLMEGGFGLEAVEQGEGVGSGSTAGGGVGGDKDRDEGRECEARAAASLRAGDGEGGASLTQLGRAFLAWLSAEIEAGRAGLAYEHAEGLLINSPKAFQVYSPDGWQRVQRGVQRIAKVRRRPDGGTICRLSCQVDGGERMVVGMLIEDWKK